jgi:tetratricopeptide (TPR) repeat protein
MLVGQAVTAGAIWVLAGATRVRTFTVPALVPARGSSSLVRPGTFVGAAGVVLVAVALWWTTLPVRADVAYRHSLERAAGGDANGALDAARTSVSLTSWNGRYWANEAAILAQGGAQEDALVAGWKAATRTPSGVSYALSAGQTAAQLGHLGAAERYFAYAAAHGPATVEVHTAWAGFLLDNGRDRRAVAQLEVADRLRPDNALILSDLATAYAGSGRTAAAAKTWRRVLVLDPTNEAALTGLGEPLAAG